MRINRIEMHKGPGLMRGAARLGWDGTYAFNADGERVPVESLENFKFEKAPLIGRAAVPRDGREASSIGRSYDVEATVDDLFVADEGIGQVTGRFTIRNKVLTFERLMAASSRLQVSGSGTIELDDASDADLRFRFQQTSIDPYLRVPGAGDIRRTPARSSADRSMRAARSATAEGPRDDATIDERQLTLFDYELTNDGPVQLTSRQPVFTVGRLGSADSTPTSQLGGSVDIGQSTLQPLGHRRCEPGDSAAVRFPDITASGGATVKAQPDRVRSTASRSAGKPRSTTAGSGCSRRRTASRRDQRPDRVRRSGINVNGLRARMGGGDDRLRREHRMSRTCVHAVQPDGERAARCGCAIPRDSPPRSTPTCLSRARSTRCGWRGNVDVMRTRYEGSLESSNGLLGLAAGGAWEAVTTCRRRGDGTGRRVFR